MIHVNVRAIIERDGPNGTEILIQKRVKPNENESPYELPGGRLEEFESFIEGLKREVHEETGLNIVSIDGEELRMETNSMDSNVEVMKPFAIYQTMKGPVDSLGAYFRCRASGDLAEEGDGTQDIKWILVDELHLLLEKGALDFSWVDRSGILYYLREFYVEKEKTDTY